MGINKRSANSLKIVIDRRREPHVIFGKFCAIKPEVKSPKQPDLAKESLRFNHLSNDILLT